MLCPEGALENEITSNDDEVEVFGRSFKKIPPKGTGAAGGGGLDMGSFKNPKTWKKSISNFFRNQLRSTKSNDGDRPSGSNDNFEEKEMSTEQKWQSLGKIFRRQSFSEHWPRSSNHQSEDDTTKNKRLAVRKVLSNYFGKGQKPSVANDE